MRIAEGDTPDRSIFAEQHSAGAKSAVYMLRTNGHKYVRYMEDYPPQLFDLNADPMELSDLAGDPAHGPSAPVGARSLARRRGTSRQTP